MTYQLNKFSVNLGCTGPALPLLLNPWDVVRFSCGLCTLLSSAGVESDAETT